MVPLMIYNREFFKISYDIPPTSGVHSTQTVQSDPKPMKLYQPVGMNLVRLKFERNRSSLDLSTRSITGTENRWFLSLRMTCSVGIHHIWGVRPD